MFDIYAAVTDRIMEQLEQGLIPWERPWFGVRNGAYSRSTKRPYSLLNQMLLGKPGEYMTYKQCLESGGTVKKGAKAKMVVFWKQIPTTEVNSKGETVSKLIPMLKYFNVFHIDDCEGVTAKIKPEEYPEFNPIEKAEQVAAGYVTSSGVVLKIEESNRAFYQPTADSVTVPLKEQFVSPVEYYGTLFHELVHSTGHSKRLNRIEKTAAFGNTEYSKEELVAEIGAAAIINSLGIETASQFRNSAAYVQSWLHALKNDKKMIVSAASKAEKAVELIMPA